MFGWISEDANFMVECQLKRKGPRQNGRYIQTSIFVGIVTGDIDHPSFNNGVRSMTDVQPVDRFN